MQTQFLGGDDIVNSFEGRGRRLMDMFSDIGEASNRSDLSVLENSNTV